MVWPNVPAIGHIRHFLHGWNEGHMSHGGEAKICHRCPIGLGGNSCWVTRVKYRSFWKLCVRTNPTYDREFSELNRTKTAGPRARFHF